MIGLPRLFVFITTALGTGVAADRHANAGLAVATQTIHHGGIQLSRSVLPVIAEP